MAQRAARMAQRADSLRVDVLQRDWQGKVEFELHHDSEAQLGELLGVDVGVASQKPLVSSRLYGQYLKRAIDLFGAVLLGLLTLPLTLGVALAVRAKLGPGVIYRQQRVGRQGRVFTMYKFRTMLADQRRVLAPFVGIDRRLCHKREDDPRHTELGRFLRRSSLDELPQLWNVVLGHMSLVGPRPELVAIVERYDPWQHQRHHVKPGLTGFWQISDRAGGLACEGVEFDVNYIRQLSFRTDCKVLIRTVPVTLRRTGR